VASLSFSLHEIRSSINRQLEFLYLKLVTLYFSWLIVEARTASTMLNKSSESKHSCLVSDLREKILSFYEFSLMLAEAYDKGSLFLNINPYFYSTGN
jgi:hypothetical protein